MQTILRAWITSTLVLWPSLAFAAIIGPADDWKPLRQGARELGVSNEMVQRILAAGLEVFCPGTAHGNGGVLNGWFLGGDVTGFYTNAHAVIEIGRRDHKADFIEPLDECGVRSFRDLATSGAAATFYPLEVPQDRRQIALATFTPQSDPPNRDRARLRLPHAIAGTRALALPDFDRVRLTVGEEVIMVSRSPVTRAAEIQACHIQSISLDRMAPGQLFTDCDNNLGNSAGLYFIRDPGNPAMLLPIALHEGCQDRIGDHKGWDLHRNTAVGILLGRSFFSLGSNS
ncbi:MAG: hypothetical protein P4M09_16225 [Devosia sp.]|nr:hypothetical protein [Devosia sp.]